MNGPVVPAASAARRPRPAGPDRPDRRSGRRSDGSERLLGVLLAPVRSLGFVGLALTGAVLLAVVVVPVVFGVWGLGQLVNDLLRQRYALSRDPGQPGGVLPLVLIGLAGCLFILPRALLSARWVANQTRDLSARWCGVPIAAAYHPSPLVRGSGDWPGTARRRYRRRMEWLLADPGTWKDLGWLAANAVVGTVLLLVPVAAIVGGTAALLELNQHGFDQPAFNDFDRSVGLVTAALGIAAAPWALRAYGNLARLMLAPSEHSVLEQRVEYLALTRQESLDTGAAELRRIERDLHDGAQARLVALGMQLGRAERQLERGNTDTGMALLRESRAETRAIVQDLRDLVRGIHPPALDSGLEPALTTLAAKTPIPTSVRVNLPSRLSAAAETILYFAAAELLTNAAKHSGAQSIAITVIGDERADAQLIVTDDGRGGARLDGPGSGLRGLAERIRTMDGELWLSSPVGGPTTVTVQLPVEPGAPEVNRGTEEGN